MKRVRRLAGPIPGLASYERQAGDGASWEGYRRRPAGQHRYRELVERLAGLQHGLCGYCEINLVENDRQVEHVVPQSDPSRGAALALDAANMIACCRGGASDNPDVQEDHERSGERSCGLAKGRKSLPEFADPRRLPDLPSLMRVRPDGRIEVDASACQTVERPASDVEKAIEILHLNVPRLRRARESYWNNLAEAMRDYQHDSNAMRAWAQSRLLTQQNGNLHKFFTTSRSYFGELSERILAEQPRDWV